MKNVKCFGIIFLFALLISISSTSCKKNDCYECNEVSPTGTALGVVTICEGGDNGAGGTYSDLEVIIETSLIETAGGTCTKL